MTELAQLFQQMQEQVIQQEPMVENIERQAEDTNVQLEQGNIHLGKAEKSARAARKKKWICFGLTSELTPCPRVLVPSVRSAANREQLQSLS